MEAAGIDPRKIPADRQKRGGGTGSGERTFAGILIPRVAGSVQGAL